MGSVPTVVRVLVVDDHEMVRRGLASLIASDPRLELAGECATATQVPAMARATAPHVVLLDVRLGEISGVEVCRDLKSAHPEIAVVMITSYSDSRAEREAVLAGANGYFLKDVAGDGLIDALLRAAAGDSLIDADARARHIPEADDNPLWQSLSRQERRVLRYIGEGMTNRQIADAMYLSDKTVKHYVTTLLRKLDMVRRTQAAAFVTHLRHEGLSEEEIPI